MLYNDFALDGFIIYYSVKVQNYKQQFIYHSIAIMKLTRHLVSDTSNTFDLEFDKRSIWYHSSKTSLHKGHTPYNPIINTSKRYGPWHILVNNKHYNFIISWADYFHFINHRKPQPLLNKQYMYMQHFYSINPWLYNACNL